MIIFSDVNLAEITFSSDGKDITFLFLNMTDGEEIGTLKCKSVFTFNFSNTFDNDDGFACYVGEVVCKRIFPPNVQHWLKEHCYGFRGIERSKTAFFNLHIESGEVFIDVGCESVEKDGAILLI